MKQLSKFGDKEVVILKQGKNAKVQDNVKCSPGLCLLFGLCFSYEQSTSPRAERGESDEQKEPPVPPAIEHITGHHNEGVLQTQLPLPLADKAVEDEPIEQEHYRQEDGKLDGVEEHIDLVWGDKGTENYFITDSLVLYIFSLICQPTLWPK